MRDLLLVIDMQNVYTNGQKWECTDTEGVADRVNRIIASGKCAEVIFTRFIASDNPKGVWKKYNEVNSDINTDDRANRMISQLTMHMERYPLYTKSVYSSLSIPQVLNAARQSDRVIVTGVVAECCVLSTIFHLVDEGITVVYLKDGVAGSDAEKEEATQKVLLGLSPVHVTLMTVEEYLREGED